ncbi:MAG: hypothetical protein ACRBHB_17160 [Arenicella sp.]
MQALVHENQWLEVTFPRQATFQQIERIAAEHNQTLKRDDKNKPVLVHNRTNHITAIKIAD